MSVNIINILSSNTVIYSRERSKRPGAKIDSNLKKSSKNCPFCPGHEYKTPPEIVQIKNGEDWDLRIVPNKYPIVDSLENEKGGRHEVVIETRDHDESIYTFNHAKMFVVLQAVQNRLIKLSEIQSIKYISWFRNNGRSAGATIDHAHAQIVALPFVPPIIEDGLLEHNTYYKKQGSCQMCDTIKTELTDLKRISNETKYWLAMHPVQSTVEFETWLVPKNHVSGFQDLNDSRLSDLSAIMLDVLKRIKETCGTENHNMYLVNRIEHEKNQGLGHMYIVIKPKTAFIAGFELSSGIFVNPVSPEDACTKIRSVIFNSERGSNEAI